ncbi:MAG TPA: UDP-N-acetylglucosamine 2-epimerase, partial [Sedimentisphaerales bacterium]|nr:UDP-N-acetylglucosamine 2-epimerase [Sedimentisphaerales bacterium]
AIRHAITKMSLLHFVSTEPYRKRVVQMGENPDRVFLVGALGLDHVLRTPRMSLMELAESIDFPLRPPYFVVTHHPVTLQNKEAVNDIKILLSALDAFPDHQVLLTYPNADNGGRSIIECITGYADRQPQRVYCTPSLGFRRYLSAVAQAAAVIGNSSSGIIEAPSFGVPTVNIGARQQGRLAADSVLHCEPDQTAIESCIRGALSTQHRSVCASRSNPYGQGDAARRIVETLRTAPLARQKHFFDLHHEY